MRNDTKLDVLWEEVEELKKSGGGGSDLPDVTEADDGKILGVVNGAWNKMDAPSGAIDYSTTEQNTGRKWIDGKPIYKKTFSGSFSNSKLAIDVSSLGIDDVVNIEGIYTDGASFYGANEAVTSSVYNYAHVAVINSVLKLDCYCNISNVNTAYVTLYYTKATETKATKKRTKKEENK